MNVVSKVHLSDLSANMLFLDVLFIVGFLAFHCCFSWFLYVTVATMQESGYRRSIFHKGLISTCIFFVMMVTGIVLIEVFFPFEGVRGFSTNIPNDSNCSVELNLCFTYRTLRSVGVFGFFGEWQPRFYIAVSSEGITL